MSCDWDVYCRTCDESLGLPDMNHDDHKMRALIAYAPQLAALAPLMNEQHSFELNATYGRAAIDCGFFAKHLGHDLVPRDEYGQCDDTCHELIRCACGHPRCGGQWNCNLKKGHEGPHEWAFVARVPK